MNTVPIESLYVTSLEEVFYGGALVALTMALHGFGMLGVVRANHTLKNCLGPRTNIVANLLPVIFNSWLIMLVHLVEVALWALFFLWKGAFPNHSTAYYFSLNEYTTVGSNFNLPLKWRLLDGMLASGGLLAFAWPNGILCTVPQEFRDHHTSLFVQRHPADDVE